MISASPSGSSPLSNCDKMSGPGSARRALIASVRYATNSSAGVRSASSSDGASEIAMTAVFHATSLSRSSSGSPNKVRNTCEGYGIATSATTSHSPLSATRPMISIACCCSEGSISFNVCGLKKGCRILRNRVCSGGSNEMGTNGSGLPSTSKAFFEENNSGSRSATSTSSRWVR